MKDTGARNFSGQEKPRSTKRVDGNLVRTTQNRGLLAKQRHTFTCAVPSHFNSGYGNPFRCGHLVLDVTCMSAPMGFSAATDGEIKTFASVIQSGWAYLAEVRSKFRWDETRSEIKAIPRALPRCHLVELPYNAPVCMLKPSFKGNLPRSPCQFFSKSYEF